MKKILFIATLGILLAGCQNGPETKAPDLYSISNSNITIITPKETMTPTPISTSEAQPTSQKTFAVIKTSLGDIKVELFADKTPITVANFVGLANGTKEWTDPASNQKMNGKPLYDGVIFHRVIKDFMIQGGDPLGKGFGGPGYKFNDEPFTGDYTRGTLAMANSGPNTNGSQFFIMHKDMALPKNYVIFGKVVSGIEVVDKIAETPTDGSDKPLTDVVIKTITIQNN
jgi:peptidyl-prolyl cis-trans isomerase A (cyclophilin A)